MNYEKIKDIVNLCFSHFNNFPKNGKPSLDQWTVLSAIVKTYSDDDKNIEIVAMGTGTKCLGKNKKSIHGRTVNDTHAEIVTRRAFLCYIYEEIVKMSNNYDSIFKWDESTNKCCLQNNIFFHLVTTSMPCGDASIFTKVENSLSVVPHPVKRFGEKLEDNKIKKIKLDEHEILVDKNTNVLCISDDTDLTNHLPDLVIQNNLSRDYSKSVNAVGYVDRSPKTLENIDNINWLKQKNTLGNFKSENNDQIIISNRSDKDTFNDSTSIKSTSLNVEHFNNLDNFMSKNKNEIISNLQDEKIFNAEINKRTSSNIVETFKNIPTEDNCNDIYRTGAKCLDASSNKDLLGPGSSYHVTGVLRTKPGRGDQTESLSCSDKIAKWNVLGVQGALLSLIVKEPIYLKSIIVASKIYSSSSLKRAVYDRISSTKCLPQSYLVHLPDFYHFNNKLFTFDKLNLPPDSRPSPTALVWFDGLNSTEVLTNGKKLGVTKKNQDLLSSCSIICKANLLKKFHDVCNLLKQHYSFNLNISDALTYHQLKDSALIYKESLLQLKSQIFPEWTSNSFDFEQFTHDI